MTSMTGGDAAANAQLGRASRRACPAARRRPPQREASARGPSYFFLKSTPALPEETLLALTANWQVVDTVGGEKPTSVPGSYLTDMMYLPAGTFEIVTVPFKLVTVTPCTLTQSNL